MGRNGGVRGGADADGTVMGGSGQTAVAVGCALAAAASFGVSNVAQTRAARRTEGGSGVDPRLLLRLLRDRAWLLGLLAAAAAYGLQATALFLAPVVLVQPLLVAELLFALPLAATLGGVRLGLREWSGAGLVAAGLAVFVLTSHPSGNRTYLPLETWAELTGTVAAVVALLVLVAETQQHRPMLRGSTLAAGASVCFGLMSVDTKVVGQQFHDDKLGALLHVQPWLLAGVAITGLLLAQTAFRSAPLSVSLPIIDVGEPVVGSILAITAFGEGLGASGPGLWAGIAAALALAIAGVFLLDTSPLVRDAQQRIAQGDDLPVREPVSGAVSS
jgi:drug/metabolite transporter (DMT)-like permease